MPFLVTLTTDFGTRDPYVGAMKGVIAKIAPEARIMDLGHEIAPGNITEAALFVGATVPYFPVGTIHTVVVDPGVGTERRPIVVCALGQVLVAPDNGIVTVLEKRHRIDAAYCIENTSLMRDAISHTFHGRDVFAPVAAHLAQGAAVEAVGARIETWVRLTWPEATQDTAGAIDGMIVHVDRFGNAITTIPASMLEPGAPYVAHAQQQQFPLRQTYGAAAPGTPLAVLGSTGYVELSVNGAHAAERFGLALGMPVHIGRT